MSVYDLKQIDTLKLKTEEFFGKKITNARDCVELSDAIFEKTQLQISASTLKRLWGVVVSNSKPSLFTLNTITNFCGYENWKSFKNQTNIKIPLKLKTHFNLLQKKADEISSFSINSIKNRLGIPYEKTIVRNFAIKKFDEFVKSNKTATAFVAPGGYGKSTLMLQLADLFFLKRDAIYKNSFLLFIDCFIIENFSNNNYPLDNLILEITNTLSQINKIQIENPTPFVLIIEGLNEISYRIEIINKLIDSLLNFISHHKGNQLFKIIITCRSNIWIHILEKIDFFSNLKSKWFNVNFEGSLQELSNIPTFEEEEIENIFKKNSPNISFEQLKITHPELIDIISNPYFLNLHFDTNQDDKINSGIDLLSNFIFKNVLNGMYAVEKSIIIEDILIISDYGQNINQVKKNEIKSISQNKYAYNELLSNGILYEYNVYEKYLTFSPHIKFTHDILFEFFIANYWLRNNEIDIALLKKLTSFYKNTKEVASNILQWIIKFAFLEKKIDFLKNIFAITCHPTPSEIKDIYGLPNIYNPIIDTLGYELRSHPNIRNELLPHFAQIEQGQKYYFEYFIDIDYLTIFFGNSIDLYLKNCKNESSKIFGNAVKFGQYFMQKEWDKLHFYFEKINKIKNTRENLPIKTFCSIIYNHFVKNEKTEKYLPQLLEKEKSFNNENSTQIEAMPYSIFILVIALDFCEHYEEVKTVISTCVSYYKIPSHLRNNRLYRFMRFLYARALLKTGQGDKALRYFNEKETIIAPVYTQYFWRLCTYFIKYDFVLYQKDYVKAKQILERIKSISKMLDYRFFEEKANSLEKKLIHRVF